MVARGTTIGVSWDAELAALAGVDWEAERAKVEDKTLRYPEYYLVRLLASSCRRAARLPDAAAMLSLRA